MLRKVSRLVVPLFAAVWLVSTPVTAQSTAERKAAAEALFVEGRELMQTGSYTAACEKFERSDALDSAPGTLLNLGDCYEKVERLASAWATFRRAAAAARARGQQRREEYARERVAAIEPQLSRLTIQVDHPAPSLQVARDGEAVPEALWGQAIPVDGGTITVRAEANGRLPWEQKVEVQQATDRVTVSVPQLRLEPESAPPPDPAQPPVSQPPTAANASIPSSPPPDAAEEQRPNRTPAYVVGGVGAAVLVTGGAFAAAAVAANGASEDHCDPDDANLCSKRGVELRDQARTYGNASTVSVVVGLVGVAGGAVLYLTNGATRGREQARHHRRFEWSPMAGSGVGGVEFRGHW